MTLEPRQDKAGLWHNPGWQEGTPGTFAVVIGVSQYPYLDGGLTPAAPSESWIQEALHLGQLQVSALTAFEFFGWLSKDYFCQTAPLAKCWLLLSPTDAEKQHQPKIAEHLCLPTLDQCKQTLRDWRTAIKNLPPAAQHQSRALFFFSGHGLQVTHERQILLPCDYLSGNSPNWNDAISSWNLRYGLESLEIPHRYYFIDACRNDFPTIRSKNVQGRNDILPEDEAAVAYEDIRAAAILYATASSQQAWQPNQPSSGISLFGQALLKGLRGQPNIELKVKKDLATVDFCKLQGFVEDQVVQLLKKAQATVHQPVQPSGIIRDEEVTSLQLSALVNIRPDIIRTSVVPGGFDPTLFTTVVAEFRQGAVRGPLVRYKGRKKPRLPSVPSAKQRGEQINRNLATALQEIRVLDPMQQAGWRESFSIGHDLFGSEQITEIWTHQQRLFAIAGDQWLEANSLCLKKVERDQSNRQYRVEFEISHPDEVGYWLQIVDPSGEAYGCLLPTDENTSPIFVVEFDVEWGENRPGRISRFEAYLSDENHGLLGEAAHLWQQYRNTDLKEAVSTFELSVSESMVREKLQSPIAATVAALILLRAGRLDLLHDWLNNLANWFPTLPDGPILWAEQVFRQEKDRQKAVIQATESLSQGLDRGYPFTSESLSYAASISDRLFPIRTMLSEELQGKLYKAQNTISSALRFFRPGGLFSSFSGFDPRTDQPPSDLKEQKQVDTIIFPEPDRQNEQIYEDDDVVMIGSVKLRKRKKTF